MKRLLLVLYSFCSLSCNQNAQSLDNKTNEHKTNPADQLIDNGFLKYADSVVSDSLKTQLKNSFDIYDDGFFRLAHIDAEELAEFSFDFFLPNLNGILAKRGVELFAKKLNDNDNSFDILINKDTIQLYTQHDLDNNVFWESASRNFFKKVNEILRSKNSDEQFYLLYGGNDLHAILLTEKQFNIINDYYKDKLSEKPYKP